MSSGGRNGGEPLAGSQAGVAGETLLVVQNSVAPEILNAWLGCIQATGVRLQRFLSSIGDSSSTAARLPFV